MLSRDVITLLLEVPGENDIGDPIVTYTERNVLGDRLDVFSSEFYQASGTDLRPDLKFRINYYEYQKEPRFRYENVIYKIIRTYSPDQENIELTGQALQNDS